MEHWVDYLVFAVFLTISLGIGLFFSLTGGKQKTNEEFLMADRSLKIVPTAISLLVSFQSAILILGTTAEVYVGGTNYWMQGTLSMTVTLVIVSWIFVPWLHPLKLTSVYKVFEMRFGERAVRIFATLLGILGQVMYMGTAMLAPSVALETATGFPANISIPIMAIVCVLYTTLGGMKAVIWTDVFQAVIMVVGMLTILIKGTLVVGGFGEAFSAIEEEGRMRWFTFSVNPTVRHTFWGIMLGNSTHWLHVYAMTQASVQRLSSLRTQKEARWTVLLNIPAVIIMGSLAQLIGVVVVAYYAQDRCDPIISGTISSANQLLPLFVRDVFKNAPGFGGLFLATLYSGALSSVSSCLSGAAANTWDDLLRLRFHKLPENKIVWITKTIVVLYGVIAVGFSFMVNEMPGPITQVSIALGGAVTGPMTGVFLVAGIKVLSWCTAKGTLFGGILGLLFNIWLTVGGVFVRGNNQSLPPLMGTNCTLPGNSTAPQFTPITGINRAYTISYLWKPFFGCLVTMLACMVCSSIQNCAQKKSTQRYDTLPDNLFLRIRRQSDSSRCKPKVTQVEPEEKHHLNTTM